MKFRRPTRILLIFPPIRVPRETAKQAFTPLGVAYLASAVRDRVDVKILDAVTEDFERREVLKDGFVQYGLSIEAIRERVEKYNPDLVGITCLYSAAFPVVRGICRVVKEIDRSIATIVGGSYPSFLPENCLNDPNLDIVVLGEGEQTLRTVIDRLKHGQSLIGIDGLAFKDGNRTVVQKKTQLIEDLDSLPFPARDLLPLEKYGRIGIPFNYSPRHWNNAPLITSRGCTAHCTFCCSTRFWGHRIRYRSPGNVLAEIDELTKRYGVREIQFQDDNLTLDRERSLAIFRGIIERKYNLAINLPNGVAMWTLDEQLVDIMAEAGVYEMTLAIESGSQQVLRQIVHKPLDLKKALHIGSYIRSKGIHTNAFYIIGFPGESREQIRQTFRYAERLNTDKAYFFVASPLPGTQMYSLARSKGMLRKDFTFEGQAFTRSAYHDGIFAPGELERMAARQFVRYSLLSLFRNRGRAREMLITALLMKRPRYFIYLAMQLARRVL